jgi:hypothetical protein
VFWTLAAFVWAGWGCMWVVLPRFSTFRSCTPQRSFGQWRASSDFCSFIDEDVKYYFFIFWYNPKYIKKIE